jgi:hypothetical protein
MTLAGKWGSGLGAYYEVGFSQFAIGLYIMSVHTS